MKENNIIKKCVLIAIPVLILFFGCVFSKSEWAYFVNLVLGLGELGLILSTFKEKHNTLKYVLVTLLCLLIFTWLVPAAYYSGTYQEQGRVQMGLFDLFNYPVTSLSYFGYIALFVLLVGGFYGIMYKIPAYRNFLDRIANNDSGKKAFSLAAVGCLSFAILLFSILLIGFKVKLLLYIALAIIPLIIVILLFKLITSEDGRNMLFMAIMMILIAVTVSVCGIQIALLFFFPLLISIILLMGYDKVTAAMVTIGSAMIGLMGSTYAYSNTNLINSILGLDIASELLAKVIILVIGLILLIFNVRLYNNKTAVVKEKKVGEKKNMKKQDTKPVKVSAKKAPAKKAPAKKAPAKGAKSSGSKSAKNSKGKKSTKGSRKDYKAAAKDDGVIVVKNAEKDADVFVPAVSKGTFAVWPFVASLVLMFVIGILAFLSWSEAFGIESFTKATESVVGFELFKFPIFSKLLGGVNSFGAWSLVDFIVVMSVVVLFVALVYKVKINDIFDGFIAGIKKALPLTVLVILVYTCLVITTYHPFQLVFYKIILGSGAKMNVIKVFLMSLTAILAGFFNVEPLYAFQSVLPYLASLDYAAKSYPLIGVIYQSLYGLTMLIAPTSVVLVTVLGYLNVSIKTWFKAVWKLLLELLVVLLILFIILLLV